MGFYDVDYSNAGTEQVTPGTYEAYVSDYTISKAQTTGNTVVSLFYTVRDDVNQPHQGAKIQYDTFVETQNSKWRWDTAAKAAGIPDKTPIQSAQDWANLMINKDLKVKVDMSKPNDQGKSYPEVKSFYNTDWPNQGRPAPILEKAYANQHQQSNLNRAANKVAQNEYSQQQDTYQQQQNFNQQNNYQQQSLTGTDPFADNRSIANGGINISDDDLPF